jgi:hypothetical protein
MPIRNYHYALTSTCVQTDFSTAVRRIFPQRSTLHNHKASRSSHGSVFLRSVPSKHTHRARCGVDYSISVRCGILTWSYISTTLRLSTPLATPGVLFQHYTHEIIRAVLSWHDDTWPKMHCTSSPSMKTMRSKSLRSTWSFIHHRSCFSMYQ